MYGKTLQEAGCWREVLQSSKGSVHRGESVEEDMGDRHVTVLGPGCGCSSTVTLQQETLASARAPPRKQSPHMAEL